MPEIIKNIYTVWLWLGPVLIVGLLAACVAVAVNIVRDVQEEMDQKVVTLITDQDRIKEFI